MAGYVDCYVLSIPKKNLAAYRGMAHGWGKVMSDHGMLRYREYVSAGVKPAMKQPSIDRLAKPRKGEVVIVAVAEFRSKAHRDKVNAAGYGDPRMERIVQRMQKKMPFDMKRLFVGEFETLVAR